MAGDVYFPLNRQAARALLWRPLCVSKNRGAGTGSRRPCRPSTAHSPSMARPPQGPTARTGTAGTWASTPRPLPTATGDRHGHPTQQRRPTEAPRHKPAKGPGRREDPADPLPGPTEAMPGSSPSETRPKELRGAQSGCLPKAARGWHLQGRKVCLGKSH